ncbi:MAG: glycoside hydrolase family 9 protein, partial [Phototrophicaceae bacterium]
MEHVSTSQIGYLCHAPKIAVVRGVTSGSFAVQVMSRMGAAPLGAAASTYEIVHHGTIQRVQSVLGEYGLCDFSGVTQPGVYQVILPDSGAKSYQFTVADGVYHRLPYLFLDFMHGWRSGYYADDLRSPLHLDDGVRSDNGQAWDAVGGWYDAGDFRKWMGHSTLPALGMLEVQEHLTLQRRSFEPIGVLPTDWLTEAAWGIPFILKMQDPQSGMIYEDVGGGHTSRWREGMTWWYENHAGCYADNADNRFTDNLTNT